ncbi:hypothetical protein MMC21_004230 [Puttea exsequens]|nr:hypothetical protein [Puttea exsequens]
MDYLTHSLLPPRLRLTQLYADAKRNYEQIVQLPITNEQYSSLHRKLKIQKDRLVAWGLEWADSKADRSDDIDTSLDRAGISDLVASIMTSINELLEEAERIQPQSRPPPRASFPNEKAGLIDGPSTQWTPSSLARLDDITKDITTSIDTLCDLSRSQQILRKQHGASDEKKSILSSSSRSDKAAQGRFTPNRKSLISDEGSAVQEEPSIISSTRINPADITFPARPQSPTYLPPSYDSTATDPGNRIFGYLKTAQNVSPNPLSRSHNMPVLVDYYSVDGAYPTSCSKPLLQHYETLVLALQGLTSESEDAYTGSLKIIGWLLDPYESTFAFVYEIPRSPHVEYPLSVPTLRAPRSLLSYLQHSGEIDASNVPCLEDRFRLAFNLVTNLLHIHAKGLTHRNINSNNVVFVTENEPQDSESKPWTKGAIRKPYLVSWDQLAEVTSPAQEVLTSYIYRHPDVERGQRASHRATHDVYSLGLVLLEIGLWMPVQKLWKTKYSRSDFKARLQEIYAKKLAAKCGIGYANAVAHCLTAVERSQSARARSRPASPEGPSTPQTEYYWKVFKPLERCCMMDALDEPRIVATSAAFPPRSTSLEPPAHPQLLPEASADSTDARLWDAVQADSPLNPGVKVDVCIWSHKIPQATRTYFDTVMLPRLSRMFAKAINRWESYEIQVCMAGETPETAKPTVLMVCRSIRRAWKILRHVNEEKGLFDIQVASGQLTRSKRPKKKRTKKSRPADCISAGQQPSRFQQKPTCGASIGCFVDEQHSEAVTFGGVVLVDGEPHGMSVHHMLEDADAGPSEDVKKGSWPPNIVNVPGLEADELTGNFELLDISDDEFDALESEVPAEFDWDNELNTGDVAGMKSGQGSHIIVTQPALDDVDPDFFPDEDEMSDDHLVIHGLGNIHASSGLRRFTHGEVAHEVDWALFKLHDDRKPTANKVMGGSKHCDKAIDGGPSYPSKVMKADALGDLQVHAFGSTSGLASGTILPEMQLTKMPGRLYPSPVWRVKGDFGVGGDSGAWVIDNATGGVCGHVTAYSECWQYATIAPMEVMLHDMEQELGASVALPTSDVGEDMQTFQQQFIERQSACADLFDGLNELRDHEKELPKEEETAKPEAVEPPSPVELSSEKPRCTDRKLSIDSSNFSLDEIPEDDCEKRKSGQSPAFATSPPSCLQPMSEVNLNTVAEKWTRAQKSKRNSGESPTKDKFVECTGVGREGLRATT